MALTDENGGIGATMLVGPTGYGAGMPYPVYQNNGGFGGFGGDSWAWVILLLLLAGNGGWGMGGFGGGDLYPWLNNSQNINGGFRDQMLNSQIGDIQNAITSGFGNVATQLCGGFAGTNAAITGAQNALAQQMYSNELASLNRSFAEQTANTVGFTNVNSGIADLRYTVATEACADRAAINDALKDVITANTASTQRILDQLCQDKIDAKNDEIARLRQEINMQSLAASQAAQTAFISQGFANEVDALYNRLNTCPVPTTPVYGRTPIFTCNNGCNAGCGCGNGFIN